MSNGPGAGIVVVAVFETRALGGMVGTGGGDIVDWLQHDLSLSGRSGRTGGGVFSEKWGMENGRSTPRRAAPRLAQFGRMLSLLYLCESEAAPLRTRLVHVVRRPMGPNATESKEPAEPLRGGQTGEVGVEGNFGSFNGDWGMGEGDGGRALVCCS